MPLQDVYTSGGNEIVPNTSSSIKVAGTLHFRP